ncbi:MAG: GAF domain-containing protein [Rhodospirillales bacterium]|nr:GAF domain-containing protein [Rhodospirillales bacterium]
MQLDRLKTKRAALFETGQPAKAGKLLSFYTRIMTKVTDSERCSIFIHDPERDRVWLKAGTGVQEHEIEVPKEGSVVGEVIGTGKPVIVSGLDAKSGTHKTTDEKTGFVTRNILCVPIKSPARNEITGAFQLLNKMNDQEFTDEDVVLAEEIAGHLQREVDGIFLDQEVFGLSERLYSSARRTMNILLALVFLVPVLALAAMAFLPRLLGG